MRNFSIDDRTVLRQYLFTLKNWVLQLGLPVLAFLGSIKLQIPKLGVGRQLLNSLWRFFVWASKAAWGALGIVGLIAGLNADLPELSNKVSETGVGGFLGRAFSTIEHLIVNYPFGVVILLVNVGGLLYVMVYVPKKLSRADFENRRKQGSKKKRKRK